MLTAGEIYLDFEREILLHVLDDQYEERQLDGKSFLWVGRARNVRHATKRCITRIIHIATVIEHSSMIICQSLSLT